MISSVKEYIWFICVLLCNAQRILTNLLSENEERAGKMYSFGQLATIQILAS